MRSRAQGQEQKLGSKSPAATPFAMALLPKPSFAHWRMLKTTGHSRQRSLPTMTLNQLLSAS
jgi:hypothetical protein